MQLYKGMLVGLLEQGNAHAPLKELTSLKVKQPFLVQPLNPRSIQLADDHR